MFCVKEDRNCAEELTDHFKWFTIYSLILKVLQGNFATQGYTEDLFENYLCMYPLENMYY